VKVLIVGAGSVGASIAKELMMNGHDVTLDSFISYVSALGLEIALVPVGQAALIQQNLRDRGRLPPQDPAHEPDEDFGPMDLMTRYAYLADPE